MQADYQPVLNMGQQGCPNNRPSSMSDMRKVQARRNPYKNSIRPIVQRWRRESRETPARRAVLRSSSG